MDNTKNKIYCGDNFQIMHGMPDESVDLIYLDPPFFSGQNYEVIWNDGSEPRSFQDTEWYGVECPECRREVIKAEKYCPKCGTSLEDAKITRKNDIWAYIDWMVPRLKEMHRILKSTGSIYLHVDWHAVHYLKVEMDRIFGIKNFQNEVIWCHYGGGQSKSFFPRKHDNILIYNKGKTHIFNGDAIRVPYDSDYKGTSFKSSTTRAPGKSYKPNPKGKIPEDFWIISRPYGKEHIGYPTQKPEALLDRIIKASSNKGNIVFDPFCGCGTSAAVAQRLERCYIGIDISPVACRVISRRVNYAMDEIIGYPRTSKEIGKMDPNEFQHWACKQLSARNTSSKTTGKSTEPDGGIDGIVETRITEPKYHNTPIQVKQHSKAVGVKDVREFFGVMTHRFNRIYSEEQRNKKENIGFIVALSFGPGARNLVEEYRQDGSAIIHLLVVEDIINKDFNEIFDSLKK